MARGRKPKKIDRARARYLSAKSRYDAARGHDRLRSHGVLLSAATALLRAENEQARRAR